MYGRRLSLFASRQVEKRVRGGNTQSIEAVEWAPDFRMGGRKTFFFRQALGSTRSLQRPGRKYFSPNHWVCGWMECWKILLHLFPLRWVLFQFRVPPHNILGCGCRKALDSSGAWVGSKERRKRVRTEFPPNLSKEIFENKIAYAFASV